MGKLDGKVALVTGSARGIGSAIAARPAADGAAVAVDDIKSADEAENVAAEIRRNGGTAVVLQADIGDWSDAQRLVERTAEELGRFDILVDNAADIELEPVAKVAQEQVRRQVAVNLEGIVATTQAAAALFPEEGGRIINVSSLSSHSPRSAVPCTARRRVRSRCSPRSAPSSPARAGSRSTWWRPA